MAYRYHQSKSDEYQESRKNLIAPIPMREAAINAIVHSGFLQKIPQFFENLRVLEILEENSGILVLGGTTDGKVKFLEYQFPDFSEFTGFTKNTVWCNAEIVCQYFIDQAGTLTLENRTVNKIYV